MPVATSLRSRLDRLRVDLTPWRSSHDFRILVIAGSVFFLGGMVGYVALPFQLYQLTGSNFAVGAMGLVTIAPLIVFGLYGGALADHVDRRKMLIATGVAQALICALLLGNSLLDNPHVWLIYVCGALNAIATSLQRPSREALLPRVVKHEEVPAAVTLTSLTTQVGQLAGPALGGVLVGTVGVTLGVRRRALRSGDRDLALPAPAVRTRHASTPRRRVCARSVTASATRSGGGTCSAPTWSTWSAWCWRCRSSSSRPSPPRC